MERLISNVQSFQQYLFGDDLDLPELQSLFKSEQYRTVSEGVCGENHPFYKRVQVNLILMVPGQDLPMHYDLPWFRNGANRFNLPQWLLLAMAGSKLWDEDQFPQVQGVAYIHEIESIYGGNFFLYPQGTLSIVCIISKISNYWCSKHGVPITEAIRMILILVLFIPSFFYFFLHENRLRTPFFLNQDFVILVSLSECTQISFAQLM